MAALTTQWPEMPPRLWSVVACHVSDNGQGEVNVFMRLRCEPPMAPPKPPKKSKRRTAKRRAKGRP